MRLVRPVPSVLIAVLAWCVVGVSPALAQEPSQVAPLIIPTFEITAADLRKTSSGPDVGSNQWLPADAPPREPPRPAALLPLYGSLIALQGLDFHSTRRAIDSGAGREANPTMRSVVEHSGAFLAVKAGATAGVIWASEKMWKKNRKGAVIFATIVNAAMAVIVANNYRISR